MSNISGEHYIGDEVHVGNDLYAPEHVELTVTGVEGIGADLTGVLQLEGRRYVVQELRITRQDAGEPITSELIRGIAVQKLVRGVVRASVQLRIAPPSHEGISKAVVLAPKERDRLVVAGPTDETLLWVARIYVIAELAGDPPAKAVRESLGIPESTANNWIRRAKDRGILDG
jgi:hypothetical protein